MSILYSYNCEKFVYNHNLYENLKIDGVEPQTHDFYELIFVRRRERKKCTCKDLKAYLTHNAKYERI